MVQKKGTVDFMTMPLKELFNSVDSYLAEEILSENSKKLIKGNIFLFWGDCTVNEFWVENHFCSNNSDFIFKAVNVDEVYDIIVKQEATPFNQYRDVFLKILDNCKSEINAISLEYDYEQYKSNNPIPSIFFEINNECDQESTYSAYKSVLKNICLYLNFNFKQITDKLDQLIKKGGSIWQIGLMFSRPEALSYIRIFTSPILPENRYPLLSFIDSNNKCKETSYYNNIMNHGRTEILIDFNVDREANIFDASVNSSYKDFYEMKIRLRDLVKEGSITNDIYQSLIRWQGRTLLADSNHTLILKSLAHFKTKSSVLHDNKVYLKCEI